ncbi:MAG: TetR/AcrR family transcriptional regulator [Planctomycetota bacterium]|nr:MAG: TetR/AcrR family transcriptional regulator [Planctomycetota bacterium]
MCPAKAVKPTRKQREQQRHRKEILDVAMKLFVTKGYENTTMAEIADEAEFAVGTLYKFFKNKESLFAELVLQTWRECTSALQIGLEGTGTEVERVERYIEIMTGIMVKHSVAARVYASFVVRAMVPWNEDLQARTDEMDKRTLNLLESVFRSGIKKGMFAKLDPKALALALDGICDGFLRATMNQSEAYTADQIAQTIKQIFLDPVRVKSSRK